MTQQASSPFVQPSAAAMNGLGVPIVQAYDVSALVATGNIVINLPAPVTKAQVRIKSSAVNAATTIAIGAITLSDGVNTVRVGPGAIAATAAGQNLDYNFDILTDLQATSITIPVTLAGAATIATMNTEVYGNP